MSECPIYYSELVHLSNSFHWVSVPRTPAYITFLL